MDGSHPDGARRVGRAHRARRHGERGEGDQAPLQEGDRVARRDGVLSGIATSAALPSALAKEILNGDSRALARGMSLVENGAPEATALLDSLYGKRPAALRVGFTGPPGAGKSTLVAEYAKLL